eukprot:gene7880-8040_t
MAGSRVVALKRKHGMVPGEVAEIVAASGGKTWRLSNGAFVPRKKHNVDWKLEDPESAPDYAAALLVTREVRVKGEHMSPALSARIRAVRKRSGANVRSARCGVTALRADGAHVPADAGAATLTAVGSAEQVAAAEGAIRDFEDDPTLLAWEAEDGGDVVGTDEEGAVEELGGAQAAEDGAG